MATINLIPISTEENDWTIYPSGTAHGVVNDSDDATSLREPDQNEYVIFELIDVPGAVVDGTVTSIRWYVRATMILTRSSGSNTAIQVNLGDENHTSSSSSIYYSENVTVEFQAGYAQNDYYGTARADVGDIGSSAWNDTSLNNLRLDINTTPADPPGISQIQMAKCYVEVTYTPAVAVTDNATFFGANF